MSKRYCLVTTTGSHFPDLISEKVSRPGCLDYLKIIPVNQWFRAFSAGKWEGEVRHIRTIAESDFQNWDLLHVNLCGATAPIIPKIKELIKGSSTILAINPDYSTETVVKRSNRGKTFKRDLGNLRISMMQLRSLISFFARIRGKRNSLTFSLKYT